VVEIFHNRHKGPGSNQLPGLFAASHGAERSNLACEAHKIAGFAGIGFHPIAERRIAAT
jgi:hypothetical protein